MLVVYKKWKRYNEIQLTKNKIYLNDQKITNHPPSHGIVYYKHSHKSTFHIIESYFTQLKKKVFQIIHIIEKHRMSCYSYKKINLHYSLHMNDQLILSNFLQNIIRH